MQRRFAVVAELAHRLHPQVERQIERVSRTPHGVIGLANNILRFCQQLGGRRAGGVVRRSAAQRAVGDVVLEDLVDDIDVRKRGMRVVASQRDLCEVGAALDQRVIRLHRIAVRLLVRIVLVAVRVLPFGEEVAPHAAVDVDELQQVDEVRGRAQDRAAVLALAVVHRSEQRFEGWVMLDQRVLDALALLERRGHAGHRRLAVDLPRDRKQVVGDAAHLLRLAADQFRDARRRRPLVDLEVLVAEHPHELALVIRGHVERRGDVQLHHHRHRFVVGRDLVDAVQHLELLAGGLGFGCRQAGGDRRIGAQER